MARYWVNIVICSSVLAVTGCSTLAKMNPFASSDKTKVAATYPAPSAVCPDGSCQNNTGTNTNLAGNATNPYSTAPVGQQGFGPQMTTPTASGQQHIPNANYAAQPYYGAASALPETGQSNVGQTPTNHSAYRQPVQQTNQQTRTPHPTTYSYPTVNQPAVTSPIPSAATQPTQQVYGQPPAAIASPYEYPSPVQR